MAVISTLAVNIIAKTAGFTRGISTSRAAMNKFAAGLGFGFRFWNQKGLMGKIEAGKSDDGWRIYFVLH